MFKDDPNQPSMTRLAAVAPGLIAAVKRLDPTRPVTMAIANSSAANAAGLAGMLDVVGYNYQEDAYDADHQSVITWRTTGIPRGWVHQSPR